MTSNSETFNRIVQGLEASDFDTIRSYIRDTVRGEWGGLIDSLSERTYGEAPEPEPTEDEESEPGNIREFIASIGLEPVSNKRSRDQHLRFHALQMAVGVDMHRVEHQSMNSDPLPLAEAFYTFLKGEA